MNIYILRHGLAVERGTKGFTQDSDRPLTSKGKRQMRKSAAAMKQMKLRFDLILSSPYERARKTAEIVAEELKLKKRLKLTDALKYEKDPESIIPELGRLKPAPKNLLLVGHEPYLSHLISRLVSGNESMAIDFKKGGLCKLEVEKLSGGARAQLVWLLTPKLMKEMA
ncbi:MAG TPA: phosphohistidine phosphatase SixA [Verrucomicrobiae bacterium]|jgi:phosphohistidine phosphatase|nr:phosphohistidine phosphatase SixA [Verrucomicrobiae bacterium]